MESILTSVKKLLGIMEDYEHFDADIIMHINSVLGILTQLGVGPSRGFYITDETALWTDFIRNEAQIPQIRSYVGMKVKLMFDPPTSSAVLESYKQLCHEFECRINYLVDPGPNK